MMVLAFGSTGGLSRLNFYNSFILPRLTLADSEKNGTTLRVWIFFILYFDKHCLDPGLNLVDKSKWLRV